MAEDFSLEVAPVFVGAVADYLPAGRQWQGIPGIERAPNGRLWAVWYTGGPGEGHENYVVLATSGDDGATWTDPVLAVAPPGRVRAYDPTLWHDPDGRLWLFWAQSFDWWDGRSGVWAITTADSGNADAAWSAPRRLCDGIMMNKPTVLSDGRWVLPAAIWEGAPRVSVPEQGHDFGDAKGGLLVASADRGESWSLLGRTRVPERVFDEHMLVERRDGSLWTLVRTRYGIGESVSTDGGLTWSPGNPSGIRNANSRFHIRRLRSGRLLLVHHDPPKAADEGDAPPRSHLTARLSADDGQTWDGGLMIDERRSVSYPDAVEDADGTVWLIYDRERSGAAEILMATFTEADILAGRPTSSACRLRVNVSHLR